MELFNKFKNQHGSPEVKAQLFNKIIKVIHLSKSDTLLDIGSGDGYYSSRFAELCGKVIAIDKYADVLKNHFYENPVIEVICEDACNWITRNNIEKVTQVFFSNSFHDMPCQEAMLKSFSNKLANGAYLHFIEFKLETSFGPPKNIRFSREDLKAKVEFHGFVETAYIDLDTHYFISFKLKK
jgi:SAM-dependent methyltransferase